MNTTASITIPVLTIILAALWNQYSLHELRREMNSRFDTVDAELHYFHDKTGNLDGRVDELSKRIK